MKLYYIDESMFQKSQFSSQILHRFEMLLSKHQHCLVLISVTGESNRMIEQFLTSQDNVTVLLSPTLFDYESIRGNLHTTFLALEDYPTMESYSGSCVEYDTDTKCVRRIYFEMFIDYDDFDLDFLVKEMEEVLNEKLQFMKKKTTMS